MMIIRKLAIECAIMAGAALLFAVLGPFGTFTMPFTERLLSWSLFAIGGYAFFRPVIAAGRALAIQTGLSRWITIATGCLFASLPTTLLVAWVFTGLNFGHVTVAMLSALYPRVLVVGALVTVMQMLIQRSRPMKEVKPASAIAETPPSTTPSARPPGLDGDILYLENEDHYVRVYRREDSELVLMRMRDAVHALDDVEGERVHRSWWVARAAVAEVCKQDRSVTLQLIDGRNVPVSRAMVTPLRKAGWF